MTGVPRGRTRFSPPPAFLIFDDFCNFRKLWVEFAAVM